MSDASSENDDEQKDEMSDYIDENFEVRSIFE